MVVAVRAVSEAPVHADVPVEPVPVMVVVPVPVDDVVPVLMPLLVVAPIVPVLVPVLLDVSSDERVVPASVPMLLDSLEGEPHELDDEVSDDPVRSDMLSVGTLLFAKSNKELRPVLDDDAVLSVPVPVDEELEDVPEEPHVLEPVVELVSPP